MKRENGMSRREPHSETQQPVSQRPPGAVDYRKVFESLPRMCWILEPKEFRILAASEMAIKGLGLTAPEVIGRRLLELVPEDSSWQNHAQQLKSTLQRTATRKMATELPPRPYVTYKGDGEPQTRYWITTSFPVLDEADELVHIVHQAEDVTDYYAAKRRRTLREMLRRSPGSEQRAYMESEMSRRSGAVGHLVDHLRAAQHVARIGSWEYDMRTGKRMWSDEIYDLLGLRAGTPPPEIQTEVGLVHPDDREYFLDNIRRAREGETTESEFRVIRLDGGIRHVRGRTRVLRGDHGEPIVLYGTLEDITERKHAEDELRTRARQQASVAELGESALGVRSIEELLELAVEKLASTLGIEFSYVAKRLSASDDLKVLAGIGWRTGVVGRAILPMVNDSHVGATLADGEPLVIDEKTLREKYPNSQLLIDHNVRSGMSAVIGNRRSPWGVIAAHSSRALAFTTDDVNFLQSVANILAAAIRRLESEADAAARVRQQAAVAQLGQLALQQTDPFRLQQEAARAVAETLDVELCKILRRLPDDAGMKLVAGVGWKQGLVGEVVLGSGPQSQAGYTARHEGPVITRDLRTEARFEPSPLLLDHGAISGISVIIAGEDGVWGVLGAHSTQKREFTEDDINFCQSVANILAEALQRHQAEENVRQSEGLLKIAGRMARLGAWRADIASHRMIWSDEVADIHDMPHGTSPTWDEELTFIAPEYRRAAHRAFRACLQHGEPFDLELELINARGRRLWARVIGQAVTRGDGTVVEVRGAVQDISAAKAAEAEMRNLASRLTSTLESITDAFFTLDQEWCFTYVNRQAERILRRSREELLGRKVWEAFDVGERSIFYREYHRAIRDNVTVDFEEFYEPFGIWLGVTAYPSSDGLAVYFRDITERKHAAERLKESEERFRSIAKVTADTIWDWDLKTDTIWWNEGLQKYFGYPPGEEPVRNLWQHRIHPDDRDEVFRRIQAAIDSGQSEWQGEYRFIRKDGSVADVVARGLILRDDRGEPLRMVGGMNDITRNKEYEQRLAQQAALLDRSQDAILVRDMEHRIRYWNRSAERLYGYSAKEAIGQRADLLLHEQREVFETAMQTVTERGEWSGEILQCRKDGTQIIVDAGWSLVSDENGQPSAILSVYTDITERIALEEQLRQSQRLESIGQLTGGVAHDFNTLLTVILGNAELLTEFLPQEDNLHQLAELTRSAALRGAELTHRLLAFARRQALEPAALDVNELVAGMEGLLQRTLPEDVEIETVLSTDLCKAYADPTQLEAVLLNLAINAKDAMPSGGRLILETANRHLGEEYIEHNPEVVPGEYVMIAVSDNGTGMSQEIIERAFDPFFTTKEKGKGTGLGLSMAYGFAKQSGGHIKIYSEPGQGTTVRLYLPRAGSERAGPADASGDEIALSGSGRILVVEDDELVRGHAETQLRNFGYEVISASNGPEALEILRSDAAIDLLFTDVIMSGGMNGPELAIKALELRPDLKVLYTSGYTENAVIHQGRLDEGVQMVQKPYRRAELARKVQQVLAGKSDGKTGQ